MSSIFQTEPTGLGISAATLISQTMGTQDGALTLLEDRSEDYSSELSDLGILMGYLEDLRSAGDDFGTIVTTTSTTDVTKLAEAFVSSFNTAMDFSEGARPGATSPSRIDASLGRTVQRELHAALTTQVSDAGTYSSLMELGFSTDSAGNLSLDTDIFATALTTDKASVQKVMGGTESYSSGVADAFNGKLENLLQANTGALAAAETRVETMQEVNSALQRDHSNRLGDYQSNLEKQYRDLEGQFFTKFALSARLMGADLGASAMVDFPMSSTISSEISGLFVRGSGQPLSMGYIADSGPLIRSLLNIVA